jgi:serine/threonine-protein kinase
VSLLKVPAPGDVITGRYRVERVLGVGGMGVVLAARHLQLGQRVAIKFIREDAASDGQVVSRFLREAHAAVALSSEHATRVFDAGLLDSGAPYMVMEYLDGVDLDKVLGRDGPMPVAQAVDFVLQACEAVAEAHARGIVHRDLKPSNLFLTRRIDGSALIKVLDFGVSKLTTAAGEVTGNLTSTGAIIGSPHYMSPEQMTSTKDVDGQTDVWALGVILYQLLTGGVPFPGHTVAEIAIKAATQDPPPLRPLRPDVPPLLEAAILKCLRRERSMRCASVAELSRSIVDFGPSSGRVLAERVSVLAAMPPPEPPLFTETLAAPAMTPPAMGTSASLGNSAPTGTMSPFGGTNAGLSRRKGRLGITVIAVLVVAVGAGSLAIATARKKKDTQGSGPESQVAAPRFEASSVSAAPIPSVEALGASHTAGTEDAAFGPLPSSPSPPSPASPPVAAPAPAPLDGPSPSVVQRQHPAAPVGGQPGVDVRPHPRPRPAPAASVYNPLDHL